ncbi:hypothetical protein [Streptococcus agalactiae]|nr:hypothetical protein [Streptococcus agalactiae]
MARIAFGMSATTIAVAVPPNTLLIKEPAVSFGVTVFVIKYLASFI